METTILKCPHCGSAATKNGLPYKNISALNTHVRMHCDKNPNSSVLRSAAAHSHKFTLLKPISDAHINAMNQGYTKICNECGELA